MKYANQITINQPIAKVINLFDNADNMQYWMPGLVSYEFLEGTPGQVGSKMKLTYKMGSREMVLIETITVRNLPQEFSGTYEHKGVYNVVRNFFSVVDENTTLYKSESEFQFSTFGMKLLGWLMPGAFKKQSQKYLEQFKAFAEKS